MASVNGLYQSTGRKDSLPCSCLHVPRAPLSLCHYVPGYVCVVMVTLTLAVLDLRRNTSFPEFCDLKNCIVTEIDSHICNPFWVTDWRRPRRLEPLDSGPSISLVHYHGNNVPEQRGCLVQGVSPSKWLRKQEQVDSNASPFWGHGMKPMQLMACFSDVLQCAASSVHKEPQTSVAFLVPRQDGQCPWFYWPYVKWSLQFFCLI